MIGDWPLCGVTFHTTRGVFEISADVMQRAAAYDDDWEIRRAYAKALPPEAVAYRRQRLKDGTLRVYWRIIRVVAQK